MSKVKILLTHDCQPCFEHEGIEIINPFYSECLRFEVNPIEYYGLSVEQLKFFAHLEDK